MGRQFEESFMSRDVRCQAVILKGRQILVIRHYNSKRNEYVFKDLMSCRLR